MFQLWRILLHPYRPQSWRALCTLILTLFPFLYDRGWPATVLSVRSFGKQPNGAWGTKSKCSNNSHGRTDGGGQFPPSRVPTDKYRPHHAALQLRPTRSQLPRRMETMLHLVVEQHFRCIDSPIWDKHNGVPKCDISSLSRRTVFTGRMLWYQISVRPSGIGVWFQLHRTRP